MNTETEYILSKGWKRNEKASHTEYNIFTKADIYGGYEFTQHITQYIDGDRKGFYVDDNAIGLGTFEELCDVTIRFDYNEYKLFKRSRTINKVLKVGGND